MGTQAQGGSGREGREEEGMGAQVSVFIVHSSRFTVHGSQFTIHGS